MSKPKFYEAFEAYLKGEESAIEAEINSDEKGDAKERMHIYKNAYVLRLISVLTEDFSTILNILGDEEFNIMARAYVKAYPSTSFTLRNFGQNMEKFLQEAEPYKNYPYLHEIASFEWAKGSVFDQEDDAKLCTLDDLAVIPPEGWETATFQFVTALKRLVYQYNVPQIWQSVNDGSIAAEPVQLDAPCYWALWRKDLNPHWFSMKEDEDWFFKQARQGKNFAELCEGLSKWYEDEEELVMRAASIVRRWIDEQMLVNITY